MKPSDYKISLDILESQSQYALPMKKGDSARKIYITLHENGVPYEIGADCFAVFSGKKPDGTVIENNCIISGNTIIYAITPQTTAASGLVDCEIKLYGADSALVTSARFSIIVDERAVGENEIESASEFTALTTLYSETNTLKTEIEQKLVKGDFKGDKGDKGDTGAQGPQGEQGIQGEKGDMPTLDTVANALKGHLSGSVVSANDVSPIQHSIDVLVRGKNLFDVSKITDKTGAIINNGDGTLSIASNVLYCDTNQTLKEACPQLKIGDIATISFITNSSWTKYIHLQGANVTWNINDILTITEDILNSKVVFYGFNSNEESYGTENVISNIQIELDETATDYTSYIDPTTVTLTVTSETTGESTDYVPNFDGTVEGIISVSPVMTLSTDTDGVTIECEYNKDSNILVKAIRPYLTPDDFEGTDSEKLTQCFNALATSGGIIHIERRMVLDANITITHSSDDNNRITVKGVGQDVSIVTNGNSFVGTKRVCGGVVFENINFSGIDTLIDGATLIRIYFNSCTFDGFTYIVASLDTYIQSIYITNCLIRNVSEYMLYTTGESDSMLYDAKVIGNIIEWGGGVANCVSAQGCVFSHNCIEGMTKDLFYFPKIINQVTIDGNYFESNEGKLIDIGDGLEWTAQSITISNNNIWCLQDTDAVLIVLPTVVREGKIVISGNTVRVWSTATFVLSNATVPLTNVVYMGNYGNLVDPNGTVTVVENTLKELKTRDEWELVEEITVEEAGNVDKSTTPSGENYADLYKNMMVTLFNTNEKPCAYVYMYRVDCLNRVSVSVAANEFALFKTVMIMDNLAEWSGVKTKSDGYGSNLVVSHKETSKNVSRLLVGTCTVGTKIKIYGMRA